MSTVLVAVDDKYRATKLAEQFQLDASDIAGAYRNKPESLSAHFNAVSDAKKDRGWYMGWTIFWGLMFFPVAVYPAWKLAEKYRTLHNVKTSVRDEVEFFRRTPPTPPAP